jgi:hypothetical protein
VLVDAERRARQSAETASKRKATAAGAALQKKRAKLEERVAQASDPEEELAAQQKSEHRSAACKAHRLAKDEAGRRARHLRIYPDAKQRVLLALWFDGVRYARNVVLEHINREHRWDLKSIRGWLGLVKGRSFREVLPERFKGLPAELIDQAGRDIDKDCRTRMGQLVGSTRRKVWRSHILAAKARSPNKEHWDISKKEEAIIKIEIARIVAEKQAHWRFKFTRKKDKTATLVLSSRYLNLYNSPGYKELFGGPDHRDAMDCGRPRPRAAARFRGIPRLFTADTRLSYDRRLKTYHLLLTIERPETQRPPAAAGEVVSIDPGVRTFATCFYARAGGYREAGNRLGRDVEVLAAEAWRADMRAERLWHLSREAFEREGDLKLQRRLVQRAKRVHRFAARLRLRARNKAAALHWDLANALCRSAELVLLPDFSPGALSNNKDGRRKICQGTARQMLGQGHCTFRDRLKSKAEEYGARVVMCREDFTSKTCGRCGRLNQDLGSSKHFCCPGCGFTIDRDRNGARNVLLRYIADHEVNF